MNNELHGDGNIIGRLGAVVLLGLAGFGLHRLNCAKSEMCPVEKTDSCCAGEAKTPAAPSPVVPAK